MYKDGLNAKMHPPLVDLVQSDIEISCGKFKNYILFPHSFKQDYKTCIRNKEHI